MYVCSEFKENIWSEVNGGITEKTNMIFKKF